MNKRIFLFLFCVLLVGQSLAQHDSPHKLKAKMYCPTKNPEAEKNFNLGVRALENGIIRRAADYFTMAIGEDSLFCDAWDNLGVIMKRTNNINKAETYFFKAMDINKADVIAYINMADIYLESGEYDMAGKLFAIATSVDSINPEGYYGMAMCYHAAHDYDKALEKINQAIALYNSKNMTVGHEVHFIEGLIYYGKGEISKAKDILEAEYNNYSNHPHMNYYLGLCYLNMENPDKKLAQKYIKKAQQEGYKADKDVLDQLEKQ